MVADQSPPTGPNEQPFEKPHLGPALANQRRCRQAGHDGNYHTGDAVKERIVECECMQISLNPLALELDVGFEHVEQLTVAEQEYSRPQRPYRNIRRQIDGRPEQVPPNKIHAIWIRDEQAFGLFQANHGISEIQ